MHDEQGERKTVGDETTLTPGEIEYLERPLTDDEVASTERMPEFVAEGFIRRKRAEELARRRGENRAGQLQAAFEAFAEALDKGDAR